MKSTVAFALSLSALAPLSLALPQHSSFRAGHALAARHYSVRSIPSPPALSERDTYQPMDPDRASRRSLPARFGNPEIYRGMEERSLEERDDSYDDEECDEGEDDPNDSSSDDSSAPAYNQTYTPPSPKPAPKETPAYAAPKKDKPSDYSSGSYTNGGSGSGETYSGTATFFTQGGVAGACGKVHTDQDYLVAIQSSMYNNGQFCGKTVAITRESTGKTIHCVVADECPGCQSSQSLDLSVAAFNALGTPDEGVFKMSWKVV